MSIFDSFVFDRYIVKKENEYFILEEIINPNAFSYRTIGEEPIIFRNCKTGDFYDGINFRGCGYVYLKSISSKEFLNSDFMNKHRDELCPKLYLISKKLNGKNSLIIKKGGIDSKLINSQEFLNSEFLEENIEELYENLKEIERQQNIIEKQTKEKRKLLRRTK